MRSTRFFCYVCAESTTVVELNAGNSKHTTLHSNEEMDQWRKLAAWPSYRPSPYPRERWNVKFEASIRATQISIAALRNGYQQVLLENLLVEICREV